MSKLVYVIDCNKKIKIGQTKSLYKRLKTIQTYQPYLVNPIYVSLDGAHVEKKLHHLYKNYRLRNTEWFDIPWYEICIAVQNRYGLIDVRPEEFNLDLKYLNKSLYLDLEKYYSETCQYDQFKPTFC